MTSLHRFQRLFLAASAMALPAHAQGVLTITPGRTASTTAGTGAAGYTGDGAAATAASLASPSALAYDAAGNLYFADTNNHAIREILKSNGTLVTVAGTGVAGFSGDGGAALAAQLDTPTGIALDGNGNLYIADSHNQRIREVVNGTIATVAGTGTAGFGGDGGPALAAQLALPTAVAVDANGQLLIADTNNQRIRAVAHGTIATVAGNGEEFFSGDGGAATAASLDQPTGIAVDPAGDLYIADKHNQRIRLVTPAGTISTLAGSGLPSFAGAFAGDGGAATAAALARPVGVSVDATGNVLIADTGNQRIRQVTGGAIATVAGSGTPGFVGDGGPLTAVDLNAPRAAVTDAAGTLAIADTRNQRLRASTLPVLAFANTTVGAASAAQTLTLANTGSANLTISQLTVSAAFTSKAGTCTGLPVTLAPGASCTEMLAFAPANAGAAAGSVTVGGSGLLPQTVLLAGTGTQATSTTGLTVSSTSALLGQPVTLTANVLPGSAGSVSFYDGATQLGAAQPVAGGAASLTLTTLAAGTHTFQAVYTGNANFANSRSPDVTVAIGDFDFAITAGSTAGGVAASNQSVVPGKAAVFGFNVQPVAGPFLFPVALSATGLPPGATVTFSPQSVTLGAAPASFTMTVQTVAAVAAAHHANAYGGTTLAFALLLLPFSGTVRRRAKQRGPLSLCLALVGTGVVVTALTGCGSGNGFFGQVQKTYTIQVIGTAKGSGGATLQHITTVQLTLQ